MGERLTVTLTSDPECPAVSTERAERFLCELANFPDYDRSPDGPNAKKQADGTISVEMPARVTEAWRRVFNLFRDLLPSYGNPEELAAGGAGLAWRDHGPDGVTLDSIPPKLKQAWALPTELSRRVFLMCELAYYLRGPAMFAVAEKAHDLGLQARRRAEVSGATFQEAVFAGLEVEGKALARETRDPGKLWAISGLDPFAKVLLRAIDAADRMRHCPHAACPAPYFIARRRSQRY